MKLVLLGAGASYGSAVNGVPPMGSALFEALRAFNPPGWGQLATSMAELFRRDFERGMTKLAETNPHAMPILQRAMAAFFFNFVPTHSSLYVTLANRIRGRRWSGVIASLNYERLLELSLLHVGVQPVVGQPARSGQVELCLPHGCCHIFCEGTRAKSSGVSFSGVDVTFDGPVIVVSNPVEFQGRIIGDAIPPVMSYFKPQKTTTAGASFIRAQRARWIDLAKQADSITIVGVKVRRRDSHIWSPIGDSSARITYCAGSSAARGFRDWATAVGRSTKDLVLKGYFADEFDNLCVGMGLA